MTRPPSRSSRRPPKEKTKPRAAKEDGLVKIAGLAAVTALFAKRPGQIERLFFEERLKSRTGEFCRLLAERRKPYRMVGGDELARIAGGAMHGGVVAAAQPRPIADFDLEQAKLWAKAGQPVIILDGIGNPHNLGAIARSMAFFGLTHLVLSDHPKQAGLSDAAWRTAEGGLEYLDVHRAKRLAETLKRLGAYYHVTGTALEGAKPLEDALGQGGAKPIALVLGNEEDGLPPATRAACGAVAMLQGSGLVQSLNVAAAAAILIHRLSASCGGRRDRA
jgi:TrmH RNA methyltransferase